MSLTSQRAALNGDGPDRLGAQLTMCLHTSIYSPRTVVNLIDRKFMRHEPCLLRQHMS